MKKKIIFIILLLVFIIIGVITYLTYNNLDKPYSIPTESLANTNVLSSNAVCAGEHRSFAIKNDDTLWGWGYLSLDNSQLDESPIKIMEGVKQIALGYGHNLVVKTDGSLWAWGFNENGEIGDGTASRYLPFYIGRINNDKQNPVKIMDDVAFVEAGGIHSLAIKTDGSLWAWGSNFLGQLGDGTNESRTRPVKIMDDVIAISAGYYHTLALKSDGSLWGFGMGYAFGQERQDGDRIEVIRNTPIKIMEDVVSIGTGLEHSLAIKSDGSLWVFGIRYNTFLSGEGFPENKTPVKILDNVISATAGNGHV